MPLVKIRPRRDTAANWTSADPTLSEGEIAREIDSGRIKWGDGVTAWAALSYWQFPWNDVGGKPAAIDAIDGLTPAADRIAYYTGAASAALATLTSFGRSLIDDANAAAAQSTLGLGTAATQNTGTSGATVPLLNGANTWSGAQTYSALATFSVGFRATGSSTSGTGPGFEAGWSTTLSVGFSQIINRTSGTLQPYQTYSSTFSIRTGAGTEAALIDAAGAVTFPLIGTTANAANAYLDSGASNKLLRSTSASRFKTQVEDVEPAYVDNLLRMRPVWYRSTSEHDNPTHSFWGLIAEELAEIDPRLVHWGYADEDYHVERRRVRFGRRADGKPLVRTIRERVLNEGATRSPQGVQYERLTVLLLGMVQRLEARVAELEAQPKPA